MLRRLIDSFGAKRSMPVDPEPVIRDGKDGGHGDHWGCVLRTLDEARLVNYLADITKKDDNPQQFGTGGKGLAFRSEPGDVRTVVLVTNNMLASAYPEVQNGPVWPITITRIVPWTNGMEAQISGTCNDAEISFFDTRYYANGTRYQVGETYDFHMGALAYSVTRAAEAEVESQDLGAKVSMKGAHAYMPAVIDNEQADIDEFWFHSPLEAQGSAAMLAGRYLHGYPIILAIPDHFEMHLNLFAGEHTLGPDMSTVKPEDDLEGFLWLQGYLAE